MGYYREMLTCLYEIEMSGLVFDSIRNTSRGDFGNGSYARTENGRRENVSPGHFMMFSGRAKYGNVSRMV